MYLKQRDKRAISSVIRGFTNIALDCIFEKRKLRIRALARIFLVNPVENYFLGHYSQKASISVTVQKKFEIIALFAICSSIAQLIRSLLYQYDERSIKEKLISSIIDTLPKITEVSCAAVNFKAEFHAIFICGGAYFFADFIQSFISYKNGNLTIEKTIENAIADLIKIVVQLMAFQILTESIGASYFLAVIIRALICTLLTWIIAKIINSTDK